MARQVKRLGDMLVEAGLLTTEQLKKALLEHKKAGAKLGEYLVREGIVRETQIAEVISRQLNIEQYHPDKYPFEVQFASLIPSDLAKKNKVAPLRRRGSLLTVAMVDPLDIATLDDLEIMTNLEVEPVICTEQELTELIYSIYGVGTQLDDTISKMDDEEMFSDPEQDPDAVSLSSLEDMAGEAPVIRLVNTILTQAVRAGASDIHISPEKTTVHLRYRVDGKLREVPAPPRAFFAAMASRLKILAGMDISVSRIPQDGRFSFNLDNHEIHVRVSSLPTIHGENMVLRLLHRSGEVMKLEDLGFSEDDKAKIEAAVIKPYGMILATGPTGSGKSTTLYALLKKINQPDINIITLEDPVEFRVDKIRQAQLNRKAGMTFASGLRSILRQDPDVVMVGEIRDAETANIAVQAALTGHRLLSTLHTNDAAGAVTRLMEMEVEPFLVASTLLVIVAQRLVRKICPKCKEQYLPAKPMLKALGLDQDAGPFYQGKGCAKCGQQGYSGRVGIYEVLLVDDEVQDMILRRDSPRQITKNLVQTGKLRTLREGAADKVRQGLTTVEEAMSTVMA
jgi:type IV pilus assembly protein PilB